jgi:hypothetical protein
MKLKITALVLGCLSAGVLVGALVTAWLMSAHRVPMTSIPLTVEMPGHLTIQLGSNESLVDVMTLDLAPGLLEPFASPSERPNSNGTSGCGKRFWPAEESATGQHLGRVAGVAPLISQIGFDLKTLSRDVL